MARAIWVALAFATLASGARYVDYSGVKMPEYAGGLDYEAPREPPLAATDEYHDHTDDVSADFDYKDKEDSVKTERSKEVMESEEWQKLVKKHKKTIDDPNFKNFDKYNTEDMYSKFKPSDRFSKHRHPRLKVINSEKDNGVVKRPSRHGRYRKGEMIDVDRSIEKNVDEFQDDDYGKINYNRRTTTMRIVRRKPRDRYMPESEDDLIDDKLLRARIQDHEFRPENFEDRAEVRRPQAPVERGSVRESETDTEMRGVHSKQKKTDDYTDYYDMKRVQGIKEKLPELIRRSTISTRRAGQWPLRRNMAPIPVQDDYYNDIKDGDENSESDSDSSNSDDDNSTSTTTTTTISTKTSSEVLHPRVHRFRFTTSKTEKPKNVTLSFAEKSRLSILKKAQRKEMVKGAETLKPPVLMQVTEKVHTLVIVEPPTSEMPWRKAKEVSDDSPSQLKKVKRLMRHKLVNNAKNIHDLTENWDDMVCDYIDVSILKSHSPANFNDVLICFISFVLIVISQRNT